MDDACMPEAFQRLRMKCSSGAWCRHIVVVHVRICVCSRVSCRWLVSTKSEMWYGKSNLNAPITCLFEMKRTEKSVANVTVMCFSLEMPASWNHYTRALAHSYWYSGSGALVLKELRLIYKYVIIPTRCLNSNAIHWHRVPVCLCLYGQKHERWSRARCHNQHETYANIINCHHAWNMAIASSIYFATLWFEFFVGVGRRHKMCILI